jgi:NAD(P)H-dependent flavin oxidoreductase YrpB (nitropropane dioxygenase family)
MSFQTALTKRLGITHPIIQAPLAGGGDTPALVAAVCEEGALGHRRRLSDAAADCRGFAGGAGANVETFRH